MAASGRFPARKGIVNRARAQSSSFRREVSEWHFAVDTRIVV